jgi:N-acetyl-anhydromuramyl-L-alanine amidase AmpD
MGGIMANPETYILDLNGKTRPPRSSLAETVVHDIDWFNANRASKRRFDPVLGIKGVVIHATAGSTSGGALQHWRTAANASAHWIVPAEREAEHGRKVIASVYEARAARHVRDDKSNAAVNGGATLINHWTLGIEIVNRQDLDNYTDPYSDWQVQATADIVRYCWAKYPNLRWVFSHASVDPSRRADPGKQFPWTRFAGLVTAATAPPAPLPLVSPVPDDDEMADENRQPCCG